MSSVSVLREDGRPPTAIRGSEIALGLDSLASGSAELSVGKTRVRATVEGPTEVVGHSQVAGATVEVHYRYLRSSRPAGFRFSEVDKHTAEISAWLSDVFSSVVVLEQYPRSRIVVSVVVLLDAGSAVATAITAAGLALCEAGIMMRGLCVGMSAGNLVLQGGDDHISKVSGTTVLDLYVKEENSNTAALTVALLWRENEDLGIVSARSSLQRFASVQEYASALKMVTGNQVYTYIVDGIVSPVKVLMA